MTQTTEQDRAEFEAVASDNGKWPKAIERDSKGDYLLMQTAQGWRWWQAARRAPAQPQWPQFEQCQDAFDAAKNRYPQGNPLGGDHEWHWFQAGWNERAKRLHKG